VKKFLDGHVSIRNTVGVELDYTRWSRLRLVGRFEWEDGTDVPLPPRWQNGVPLPWRTGYGDGTQTRIAFDLRYGLL